MMAIANVDAGKAECRDLQDQEAIRRELEERVGTSTCNTLVRGLLREAVVREGRKALDVLPAAQRATSDLVTNVGVLHKTMGNYDCALPLYIEALEGKRLVRGDNHPSTLKAIR